MRAPRAAADDRTPEQAAEQDPLAASVSVRPISGRERAREQPGRGPRRLLGADEQLAAAAAWRARSGRRRAGSRTATSWRISR